MEYLQVTTGNRVTGMEMSGVCVNYGDFWNDIKMTANCEFDKDDYSPTERYHNRLSKIMENVWNGKDTFPTIFSIRLEKYISLVDYPVRYTFAIVDKEFFKRTYRKGEIPEEILKKCLARDNDCVVFYVGMNR
ncbi:TPA: conjugal transfer protein [Clostridioides difficile]|nr:conjugal transfer protein [Clostridioides difficile]HEK4826955.1 conjugal transfer protein [Clostridioides difficile]